MITEAEAIREAGLVLAEIRADRDALSPRAAAEKAWYRGHPLTVDAIEALIVRQRADARAKRDAGQRTAA